MKITRIFGIILILIFVTFLPVSCDRQGQEKYVKPKGDPAIVPGEISAIIRDIYFVKPTANEIEIAKEYDFPPPETDLYCEIGIRNGTGKATQITGIKLKIFDKNDKLIADHIDIITFEDVIIIEDNGLYNLSVTFNNATKKLIHNFNPSWKDIKHEIKILQESAVKITSPPAPVSNKITGAVKLAYYIEQKDLTGEIYIINGTDKDYSGNFLFNILNEKGQKINAEPMKIDITTPIIPGSNEIFEIMLFSNQFTTTEKIKTFENLTIEPVE